MDYTPEEVIQYVREEDVKFIRMAFCDMFGRQKNVAVMAGELRRAFEYGVAVDGSAIAGFGEAAHSDLILKPDGATLTDLPWRPQHGRVVQMYCDIIRPDGTPFEGDTRRILREADALARARGVSFSFGPETEFYLFQLDEEGRPTRIPQDEAGYMDVAPEDRGENVRREICLTLERMGILPESSHHESGPGQNEIAIRHTDAVTAADHAVALRTVVRTIAGQNGLWADLSPKPLPEQPGSGMHWNFSAGENDLPAIIAGILKHIGAMTVFLNPTEASYLRLGRDKTPRYAAWGNANRTTLIRVPAAFGPFRRGELRSPDPMANPYLALALLIRAGLEGLEQGLVPPPPVESDLFQAPLPDIAPLPGSLTEAASAARASEFIRAVLPARVIDVYAPARGGTDA